MYSEAADNSSLIPDIPVSSSEISDDDRRLVKSYEVVFSFFYDMRLSRLYILLTI